MQCRGSRIRMPCRSEVQSFFDIVCKRIQHRTIRTPSARRGHHACLDLANDLFPRGGIILDVLVIESVEHQPCRLRALIVTGNAILVEQSRIERSSGCCGRLRPGRHLCTTGADQPQRGTKCTKEIFEPYVAFFACIPHLHSFSPVGVAINFLINAIELGFAFAGCVARNTPSPQLSGVRPSLSFTSSLAPLDTRYSMISSEPRLAAPMTAVMPIEFASLTLNPSS